MIFHAQLPPDTRVVGLTSNGAPQHTFDFLIQHLQDRDIDT